MRSLKASFGFAALAVVLTACGDDAGKASGKAKQIPPPPPEIAAVFERSCKSCHNTGAGGAPRTGHPQDWEPRLFQGLDVLLDHTISGYKGMPPMGMCMDCSEEQFIALIEYMAGQELE